MKTNRFPVLFAVLLAVALCLSGCGKYRQIKITEGKIDAVSVSGLRTINLTATVGIDNPAGRLDVREADGVLRYFGKVIGKVTLNPFIVNAKSNRNHKVTARIDLDSGVGFIELMSFLDVSKLYVCTIDIHVKGYVANMPVKINIKEIPVTKLLQN